MITYEDYLMKRNGLWTERLQEVEAKGFSESSAIARLIYSCEVGSGIDQHAAEDLKIVSALLAAKDAEIVRLESENRFLQGVIAGMQNVIDEECEQVTK